MRADHKQSKKVRVRPLFVLIIVLLFAIIYLLWISQTRQSINSSTQNPVVSNDGVLSYQNGELGYVVDYPADLSYEGTDEILFFRKNDNGSPASLISLRPMGSMFDKAKTYEENLKEEVSSLCAGSGPMSLSDGTVEMSNITCPKEDITLEKFRNTYNIEGYRVKRKVVTEARGVVQWEWPETVVVYQLYPPDNGVLLIEQRNLDTQTQALENEFLMIVDSFRYIHKK